MEDERAETLIKYIRYKTKEATWYSCKDHDGRTAEYLFNVLSIPDLDECSYQKWMRKERITPSLNLDEFYVRKFGRGGNLYVAHGTYPNGNPGEVDQLSPNAKKMKKPVLLPPHIPDGLTSETEIANTAVRTRVQDVECRSPGVINEEQQTGHSVVCNDASENSSARSAHTLPQQHTLHIDEPKSHCADASVEDMSIVHSSDVNTHMKAAHMFMAGEEPLRMTIGNYTINAKYDRVSDNIVYDGLDSAPPLVEVLTAAVVRGCENRARSDTFQLRGSFAHGGNKRTYMRITKGQKKSSTSSVSNRHIRRGVSSISTVSDTLSGGSDVRFVGLLAGTLRKKPYLFHEVVKRTGIPILQPMQPARVAALIEHVGITGNQYKQLKVRLEAEWPELKGSFAPAQIVRKKAGEVASSIAMETVTLKLNSKATNGRVTIMDAACVRAISMKQAMLVIAHQSMMSGKTALDGQPPGEIWACLSCDAGGNRNGIYGRYLLKNSDSRVQSIREIYTLALYDATKTADDYANHKIAFWDKYGCEFDSLAYKTTMTSFFFEGMYLASIFVSEEGHLPPPVDTFNRDLLMAEIGEEELVSLRNDKQTWDCAPGDHAIFVMSSETGCLVAVGSAIMQDSNSMSDQTKPVSYFADDETHVSNIQVEKKVDFGDILHFRRIITIKQGDDMLSIKLGGLFVLPVPINLKEKKNHPKCTQVNSR